MHNVIVIDCEQPDVVVFLGTQQHVFKEVPILLSLHTLNDVVDGLFVISTSGGGIRLLPHSPLPIEGRGSIQPIYHKQ